MNANYGFDWAANGGAEDDVRCGDERISRRHGSDARHKQRPSGRVGGMHCRRQKRWTWGHGRAARLSDAMAFARCVAFAVALASSTAMANGFSWVNVGEAGNPGNPANNNFGAVGYAFRISAFETTNAQYAAFLNNVDPTGANSLSLYNANMGTNVNGGITNTGTAGSVYAVKSGFDIKPVNFVSWNSAARFANWLTTGGTSTETGSYNMNDLAAGRLATAVYVLPSFDEYYKAAFYTGSGSTYTLYQTGFDAPNTPTPSGVGSPDLNIANYGGAGASPASTGPLDIGSFTNATSAYGLFDALGNVTEYTDSINPLNVNQRARVGGNWSMALGDLAIVDALAAPSYGGRFATEANLGFRIAAVPEPGTIGMAVMGGLAMVGLGWMKRRRNGRDERTSALAA